MRKRNIGIQALWGLTTIAKQPGEIAAGTLKPSHMGYFLVFSLQSLWWWRRWLHLSSGIGQISPTGVHEEALGQDSENGQTAHD